MKFYLLRRDIEPVEKQVNLKILADFIITGIKFQILWTIWDQKHW